MSHSNSWDETAPNGAVVAARTLDTIIQQMKVDIRERLADLGCTNFGSADPVALAFIRLTGANPYVIGGTANVIEFRLDDGVTVVAYIDTTGRLVLDAGITAVAAIFTTLAVSGASTLAAATLSGLLTANGAAAFNGNVTVATAQAAITPHDAGNSGVAITIDWDNGNNQLITLTGAAAITLNNPVAGSVYVLKLLQDATGSRQPTWPASVKWAGGSFPGCTGTASHSDLITLYYDGTNYLGTVAGFDFSA